MYHSPIGMGLLMDDFFCFFYILQNSNYNVLIGIVFFFCFTRDCSTGYTGFNSAIRLKYGQLLLNILLLLQKKERQQVGLKERAEAVSA